MQGEEVESEVIGEDTELFIGSSAVFGLVVFSVEVKVLSVGASRTRASVAKASSIRARTSASFGVSEG